MKNKTYFLAQDRDCHWYIVPTELESEWYRWLDLDSEDEEAWEVPEGIIEVGGSPSLVKFEKFTIK